MAVVNVIQSVTGRDGNDNSPDGREFQFRKRLHFTALTDSATDTEDEVLAHADVPKLRDALASNPWYRVVDRSADRVAPFYWNVEIAYESVSGQQSPIDMRPKRRWRSFKTDERIDTDADGKPICTVLGEPYQDVTAPIRTLVLEIERNLPSWNDEVMAEYLDATNSDPWFNSAPGQLIIDDLSAEEVHDEDFTYYRVRAEIWKRWYAPGSSPAHTWWKRILHQGFRFRLGEPGQPVDNNIHPVVEGTRFAGEPLTKPVLLDPQGRPVDFNLVVQNPANAFWQEFKIFRSKPYSALGLL